MGDFSTMDDIVAGLANTATYGGRFTYNKNSITTVAGVLYSLWTTTGWPGAGAAPGAAATPTNATAGALNLLGHGNAPAGGTSRLLGWDNITGSAGNDYLYDRLAHMSGLSGNVLTAQTVNASIAAAAAAGRCNADGSDVEWFIEGYSAPGAATPTITISYTNQAGVSGRTTTVTMVSALPAGRLIPITTLQSGDTSIKSIESITVGSTMTTAGNFGITAGRKLAAVYGAANQGISLDFAQIRAPKIGDNACLWLVSYAGTTTSGNKIGAVTVGSVA